MRPVGYTYQALQYVHDPAAGEALNIGVLLFTAHVAPHVFLRFDRRYERLSKTFQGFDGAHFRRVLRTLELSVEDLQLRWSDPERLRGLDLPENVESLARVLWPDQGLSFQTGPMMAGLTSDPGAQAAALYDRLVLSQQPDQRPERRSDEEVWRSYERQLSSRAVTRVLQPTVVRTDDFEHTFEHAYKNERWHALQPLSLDYQRAENMQTAAARWLGYGVALGAHPDMGKLYLLLGQPRLESHRRAYTKAKNLLHKMPLDHELIEEDEADGFADQLYAEMRAHGIISEE